MFNGLQLTIFLLGALALVASWVAYRAKRQTLALGLLILGALLIRLVVNSLELFLNRWDEQYHALVAKNMLQAPFTPQLYVEDFAFGDSVAWSHTTIWLHKQPLFLWQMALSMKLFGTTAWAVRVPSAIMGALQCFFLYRMGKHALNDRVGYYAAFLWATAYFNIQQVCGWEGMDHNDVAFVFYLTGSLWAWVEYWNGKRHYWVWIGVFAGCAILNKWLTGLLVYSGWGIALLADAERRQQLTAYLDGFKALAVTIAVFLPWQLYISYRFPVRSAHEYSYNSKHIFEAVEGHGGTMWFYFERWQHYYGLGGIMLTIFGIFMVLMFVRKKGLVLGLTIHLVTALVFFSFVVATKMPGYGYIIAGVVYLMFGAVVYGMETLLQEQLPKQAVAFTGLLLVVLSIFNLRYGQLELLRIEHAKYYRQAAAHNIREYQKLDDQLDRPHVILNVPNWDAPQMRFFSQQMGYDGINLPIEALEQAKAEGKPIAILRWEGGVHIPPDLVERLNAKIIDINLMRY